MADEVSVRTDLDALFGGIADRVVDIVRDEIRSTAESAVAAGRAQLPRRTGALADALKVVPFGDGYRVTDDLPYAAYAHRAGSDRPAVEAFVIEPLRASFADGGEALQRIAQRITGAP